MKISFMKCWQFDQYKMPKITRKNETPNGFNTGTNFKWIHLRSWTIGKWIYDLWKVKRNCQKRKKKSGEIFGVFLQHSPVFMFPPPFPFFWKKAPEYLILNFLPAIWFGWRHWRWELLARLWSLKPLLWWKDRGQLFLVLPIIYLFVMYWGLESGPHIC
jgi:hypothetical protein